MSSGESKSSASASSVRRRARPLAAIVLAAGKGTRMKSDLPKVAHEVAGRAMVEWVVDAAREVRCDPIVLVIGYSSDIMQNIFADADDILFAYQEQQFGTGHATLCAEEALTSFDGDVFVLAGDGPLIRAETLRTLQRRHLESGAACTLATSVIENPTGYGRIVRDANDRFAAIVEQKNATPEQLAIREIYPSYACFDAQRLFELLRELEPDAVSGEYYLTEVPAMLHRKGERVELVDAVPPDDVLSINTPEQLAEVDAILRQRLAEVEVTR